VRFLSADSIFQKFAMLKEWDLMSYLPQYEVASLFSDSARERRPDGTVLEGKLPVDSAAVVPLAFEVLVAPGRTKW
jgi:hypothetical protein